MPLTSAAVSIDVSGGVIQQARVVMGYVAPTPWISWEASQAMLIVDDRRMSNLAVCLEAAPHFQLKRNSAEDIIAAQISVIRAEWTGVCEEAGLSEVEQNLFSQRMFLNPFIFEGAPERLRSL